MNNKRCASRKISLAKERYTKRKISRDEVASLELVDDPQPTPLPKNGRCKFEQASQLLKDIAVQYTLLRQIFQGIIQSEIMAMDANEKELDALKNRYIALKTEEIEMKRKRWCNWCDKEATFLSSEGQFFFCTTECEREHQANICYE